MGRKQKETKKVVQKPGYTIEKDRTKYIFTMDRLTQKDKIIGFFETSEPRNSKSDDNE